MNTKHALIPSIGAVAFLLLFSLQRAGAVPFIHADVQMSNIQRTPATGTFNWLSDWELTASALVFDGVNGFKGESNFGGGQPAIVTANAVGGYSSAFAQVAVDGSGSVLSLQSSMDVTFPSGVPFVSAFPAASAYREFVLTGGTGAVSVLFSFDYLGHLQGDALGHGADFRALLSISGPFDLSFYNAGYAPMNDSFSGTLSETMTLQYNTIYSIALSVDGDLDPPRSVPDTGPGGYVSALVFFCLLACRSLSRVPGRGPEL